MTVWTALKGDNVSRRAFLRGGRSSVSSAMRPPWAKPEVAFAKACTGCGDCISACEEGLLVADENGYPTVEFQRAECTFCADCIDVCQALAFTVSTREEAFAAKPWTLVARIKDNCMAFQGVTCQSCGDNCETRAIRFAYSTAGIAIPTLTLDDCTGCGACVAPCPVDAITIFENNTQEREANA